MSGNGWLSFPQLFGSQECWFPPQVCTEVVVGGLSDTMNAMHSGFVYGVVFHGIL